jgi:hypothetical protein
MIALQILFTYWPSMHTLFHTAPFDPITWGRILVFGVALFFIAELEMRIARNMGLR